MEIKNWIWVALTIVSLPGGLILGYIARKVWAAKQINTAEARLQNLIQDAKNKQRELLISAKDKAIQVVDDAKREAEDRRRELRHMQERLEQRESRFDQKLMSLEEKSQRLQEKATKLEAARTELYKIKEQQMEKLEKIAGLSKEEAKKVLLDNTEREMKDELVHRITKLQHESNETLEKEGKDILSRVIQRTAAAHTAETTTTIVNLPSDDMKGRIIGREGRNIKALEQLTGVEIIVDDTPEAIVISGFSPIRRHLAKRTLEKLIEDGRIHPGRIEETIEKAKKELALDIKKAGEEAAYEVGIAGLDPKLLQIIGRLKYRTSYGQNNLRHSIEVAHLSALLAEELGADVAIAKKGGFLHDIGKAVDHEIQGTHPEIGKDIGKKFNLPKEIIDCIAYHHEDEPPSLEAVIVKVADAISGARPGARKDTYEHYLQRLDELESLAKSFEGVEKSYAIQAGREVRVFVMPEKIDDLQALKLAKEIATKIEHELKYPGEIKVNVIRETRIIEYAH
ncbi:MAG: ribonuclease Y [Patescibacteria group bacterium]|nr:ribonuclease Y [Patescibacteria group bacterium]MDD5715523.1 ribonuclease Y [Patescibacteria group bacterium]